MGGDADHRALELIRLRSQIRLALRDFQRLTGFAAITALGLASASDRGRALPSPPVHPRCAERLRGSVQNTPCDAEWREHLRSAQRTHGDRIHTCPLGLRCVGVPIFVGDELLGMGKLVCGSEVSEAKFRSLVRVFEALILRPCQDFHVSLLRREIHDLETSVNQLQRVKLPVRSVSGYGVGTESGGMQDNAPGVQVVIGRVLKYLGLHFAERDLSLVQVAKAVGRNEKYVAHLFVQQVGQRMRTHINSLRIQRSCELLLQTGETINQIACDCGFGDPSQFRQAFRRAMGVTATEYRQIFSPGA
jgi:AraC-like DNA-binding protein